jgi:hypothetical protein
MFDKGQVVRFHYLWNRQALEGEETGRKARPVCVVVRTAANPGVGLPVSDYLAEAAGRAPLPVDQSDRVPPRRSRFPLLDCP